MVAQGGEVWSTAVAWALDFPLIYPFSILALPGREKVTSLLTVKGKMTTKVQKMTLRNLG
jgi:hypothetical protein